jgi:glycosyltransferase involved in cell wall biosynthesis
LKITSAPVLFISYDGLLDPLGGSQILPYVRGFANHPRSVSVLSFEKANRLSLSGCALREKLSGEAIVWISLTFTRSFGVIGKLWDLARMYYFGLITALRAKTVIVHARGHAAAQVGLFLKRVLGCKLIFDFRGLWVDERVDKGGWDLSNPFHKLQYRYYKRVEKILLQRADQVVVLTQAVVEEVIRLGCSPADKITVIPCCADFDHFRLLNAESRRLARQQLDIPEKAFVLGYLGSVGGMYMSERFFRLVELAAGRRSDVCVLALTPDIKRFEAELAKYLPSSFHLRVKIRSVTRDEVAEFLPAMNLLVSFIKPSYARIASSPTKLAEAFAVGVPAICNYGVGDVAALVKDLDAGAIVDPTSDADLDMVAKDLDFLGSKGGLRLREAARLRLGLEIANQRYREIYMKLEATC